MNNATPASQRLWIHERGTTLAVVLVLLVGVTLISLAGVNSSTTGLRMASNVEGNTNSFQTGLAAIDYVISDTSNLPATGPLKLPVAVTLPSGSPFKDPSDTSADSITAAAARIEDCGSPPRSRTASSMLAFSAFSYEITAVVDKNDTGMGRSSMAQGYILLGLDDLAKDSINVLAMNYPEHPSLNKNGEFVSVYTLDGLQRSWINRASFGLFDPPQPPQFDNRPRL